MYLYCACLYDAGIVLTLEASQDLVAVETLFASYKRFDHSIIFVG